MKKIAEPIIGTHRAPIGGTIAGANIGGSYFGNVEANNFSVGLDFAY